MLNILFVGLGLIGGSMVKRLLDVSGYNVGGADINARVMTDAITKGYIKTDVIEQNADVIVMCLYPAASIEWLKNNMDKLPKGVLVTDCLGVKRQMYDFCAKNGIKYVGMHPMAGRECKGYENSLADLFVGANFILVEGEYDAEADERAKNVDIVCKLANDLGAGNIIKASCAKHDKMIGYTSQLEHVIASCVVHSKFFDEHKAYEGNSFEDFTRISRGINPIMWSELFCENKQALCKVLDEHIQILGDMRDMIFNEDVEGIYLQLEECNEKWRALK
ncbi:MAG: prephenate dehydrogenase/arogenate dehydrogenase family protein [Clostridiales bacterium]|jgi:prephenate dehydrogenase|nr:prephenate dehydrogenase/arogenate dehydrogenase family protein [Clostridiales bacterium]